MSKKNDKTIVDNTMVDNSAGLFANTIPKRWTLSFTEVSKRVDLTVKTAPLFIFGKNENDLSDRVVSFGTRNPWSAAVAHISKEAVDHTTVNITMEDCVTDNTEQLNDLFGWIRQQSRVINEVNITNVHLPGVYYPPDSAASPSDQGGNRPASTIKAVVKMPWRNLLSASSGEHDVPLFPSRLVISPGRYGAAQGGWNRLWFALMKGSLASEVLVCEITSLDDLPGAEVVSDFLRNTKAFQKMEFFNFHLAKDNGKFMKAVGQGLKGNKCVTSLTMRPRGDFPTGKSPNGIAGWLFLGGLNKNAGLNELHLALGVGSTDTVALATGLRSMMENRRRDGMISTDLAATTTMKQLTLFCTVHTLPGTKQTVTTDIDEVMNVIGDPTAVPLRKLQIVFVAFPDCIQQSLALAVAGAPCLEEVVVDGPPLDDVQNIHPELVAAIKTNATIHKFTIGGEALHVAGGVGATGTRRAVRNALFRNTLGWDRVHTDPHSIVRKLIVPLLGTPLNTVGLMGAATTAANRKGSGNEDRGEGGDHDNDYMDEDNNDDENEGDNDSNRNTEKDPSHCMRSIIVSFIKMARIEDESQEVALDLLNEMLDLLARSGDAALADDTARVQHVADANNFNEGNGTDADSDSNDSSAIHMSRGAADHPGLHGDSSSDGPDTQAGKETDDL